jgi:aminocarboxymuconate-semialdehyde decarboxylase
MSKPFSRLKSGPVDLHSHMTPANFPPNPGRETRWPCMHHSSATSATVMIAEKPFRVLDSRSWDCRRRIEDMDRDGIAVQALSPMPELLSYWFGADDAGALCDFVNHEIANLVAAEPSRFAGLGMVPMQDSALAVRHLQRLEHVFGLAGVEVGSNINGKLLGDRSLDPVWEAAESLGLTVFVHALHPKVTAGLDLPAGFGNAVGFPLDTAMSVVSLLANNTLERYPNLRIGFSHGGGAVAPIGRDDLSDDPELATNDGRVARVAEIDAAISKWSGSRSLDSALGSLAAADVPASKIYTAKDIADDPHFQARGMIQRIQTRSGYEVDIPGIVPKLSVTPGAFRFAAPDLGADTIEILTRHGVCAERISELIAKKVVR